MVRSRSFNIKAAYYKKVSLMNVYFNREIKKLVKKIGQDRELDVKKGGIVGLRRRKKQEGGI